MEHNFNLKFLEKNVSISSDSFETIWKMKFIIWKMEHVEFKIQKMPSVQNAIFP